MFKCSIEAVVHCAKVVTVWWMLEAGHWADTEHWLLQFQWQEPVRPQHADPQETQGDLLQCCSAAVLQWGDRQIMWHFAGTCQEVLCCGHGGQHAGSCGQVWGHKDITMNDLLGHFYTQELVMFLDPCISFNVCTDIFKPTWLMDEVLFYLFRILQLIIKFPL